MALKTAEEILRGNPVSSLHQPHPVDLVEYLERITHVNDPIAILAGCASNIAISGKAIGGDRKIENNVFLWDSNQHDGGGLYVPGTQFNPAAFGTAPLNKNSGNANSLLLQTLNNLEIGTGRPVFGVILAMGGHYPEAFITDSVLSTNGWTRDPSNEDMTLHYSNIAAALAAIPGSKTAFDGFIYYQAGDFDQGKAIYQPKISAVFDGLETAGLIDPSITQMVGFRTAPGRTKREEHDKSITHESAIRPNLVVIETHGVEYDDDDEIHLTGRGTTVLGKRAALGLLGANSAPSSSHMLVDETIPDPEASLYSNLKSGDTAEIAKIASDGIVGIDFNTNFRRFRVLTTDTSDEGWAPFSDFIVGDVRRNGDNIYSAGSTDTSGSIPPTHTSGTASDGVIVWTWERSIDQTLLNLTKDGLAINGGAKKIGKYDRDTPTLFITDASVDGNIATFSSSDARFMQFGPDVVLYGDFEQINRAGLDPTKDIFVHGLPIDAATNGFHVPGSLELDNFTLSSGYTWVIPRVIAGKAYFKLTECGSDLPSQPLTVASITNGVSSMGFFAPYRSKDPLA